MKMSEFKATLAASLLLSAGMMAALASDTQSSLSDSEKQLSDMVNQYRQENGLATLPVTNALTKVARAHIEDLNSYHPDTKNYGTGQCNVHSWSSHGDWTGVCYTGESAQFPSMWNKPKEITESYEGNGYEIAYWNSIEATPSTAIAQWKGSVYHSDTILQRGAFASSTWRAMGVGIDGSYAVVWFGQEVDPSGAVSAQQVSTDYPDQECPYSCLTLTPKKAVYAQGETVQIVLKRTVPGSSSLVGAHYTIEKKVEGNWVSYYENSAEVWRFRTPKIDYEGLAKLIQWDQRQMGEPDNMASRGPYRMLFYAPEAYDGYLTAEFTVN